MSLSLLILDAVVGVMMINVVEIGWWLTNSIEHESILLRDKPVV